MTSEERDGLVPVSDEWSVSGGPPRIWAPGDKKVPGCGFTRSLGDGIAHTLGVTAHPEICEHRLVQDERVMIITSDGVTDCKWLACYVATRVD